MSCPKKGTGPLGLAWHQAPVTTAKGSRPLFWAERGAGAMSQPLGQSLDAIGARIDGAPALLIALAYDGTLSPLADTPEQAELSAANRRLLRALARHANVAVAV